MTDSRSAIPPLLEEFETALTSAQANPEVVRMANAKWQGALLAAVSQAPTGESQNIATICRRFEQLGTELLSHLDMDNSDPRIKNTALQALIPPATRELRTKGELTGDWLPSYAEAIEQLPMMLKVATSQVSSSTSLGMTLTGHYADLLAATNEFSFLRQPTDVVTWAHAKIDQAAKQSAENIAPHEDRGAAYQNQLNVHRRLFLSAYRTEAAEWELMMEEHPETLPLYSEGMPLTGVEERFEKQAATLQSLMSAESKQTPGMTR